MLDWNMPGTNRKLLALTPQSKASNNSSAIQNDTPDYPDPGVRYAGFAKVRGNGNTWVLLRQEPYKLDMYVTNTQNPASYGRADWTKTKTYITTIVFRGGDTGRGNGAIIKDVDLDYRNKFTVEFNPNDTQRYTVVQLPVPLEFVGANIEAWGYGFSTSADDLYIELIGWTEQIP